MAGAGYKLFNTGDVLTAAQVNTYLQEQTVMVFASSTARTTALSGVLAEGMVSYLQDTNAVEVYNGTSWVNVGNAGDITEVQAGVGISIASGTGPIPVITNSSTDLITTAGDILYGTAADTVARLGIGTAGQVLKVNSGATAPEWGAAGSGAVVQVVGAVYTTDTSSASSTFTDTGLTATITPTSASNKVLVIIHHNSCGKSGTDTRLRIRAYRGATQIAQLEGTGGANDSSTSNFFGGISIAYLDSPATTSATTYKTQFSSRANTGTVHINTGIDSTTSASTITLMEVTP